MKFLFSTFCYIFVAILLSTTVNAQQLSGYLNGNYFTINDANFADMKLTTCELTIKYGYPCEIHHVQTPDGYILEIHRVPYGKLSPPSSTKTVVYLQHGLVASSSSWVMKQQDSLAFILADLGYDVFMGNSRGNFYSRNHRTLDPNNPYGGFWNFSVHEHGIYDITTSMDYALSINRQSQLIYIGHSMGTTSFFVAMSTLPSYNAKIKLGIMLAPVVYLTNLIVPIIRVLAPLVIPGVTSEVLNTFGPGEFQPNNDLTNQIRALGCAHNEAVADLICDNLFFLIYGFDPSQFNTSQLPVYFGHAAQGASTKDLVHLGQFVNTRIFRQYDYGAILNLLKYESLTPPLYDLTKVTAPVAMYYGNGDWLATAADNNYLIQTGQLPNVVLNTAVPWDQFNHGDFLLAIDAKALLYNHMTWLMSRY